MVEAADPADANFADVDCTAATSATCYAVTGQVHFVSATAAKALYVRKNSSSTAAGLINKVASIWTASGYSIGSYTTAVDTGQVFEYAVNNADVSAVYITITGYWETTT